MKGINLTDNQWTYFIHKLIEEGYITPDGEPIKCTCGSTHLLETAMCIEQGYICEYNVVCTNCGSELSHWAYGHFGPTHENYIDVMPRLVGEMRFISWTTEGAIKTWAHNLHQKIRVKRGYN